MGELDQERLGKLSAPDDLERQVDDRWFVGWDRSELKRQDIYSLGGAGGVPYRSLRRAAAMQGGPLGEIGGPAR